MDAHLFRLFADPLEPILNGCRIEKIQEPLPGLLAFSIYASGQKKQFYVRFDRQSPFCFLSSEKVAGNAAPSAQIMRIRKYFAQKRVAAVVFQIPERKIWLMAPGTEKARIVWLCLDLARGPELHFLEPANTPEAVDPPWPSGQELADALLNWRDWPWLTPALRKTMKLLDDPEQRALLEDLRCGQGDVFLYYDANDRLQGISAWPLPAQLKGDWREKAAMEILPAFAEAGKNLVFARMYAENANKQLAPMQRRQKQIKKTLLKLEEDEKRLQNMLACEKPALALAANLWRWPADLRATRISAPLADEDSELEIALDERFSVRENMERLFHRAARAKRGLKMLLERRQNLELELEALDTAAPPAENNPQAPAATAAAPGRLDALRKILPKNVQAYISSDGYQILLGKDARGNRAMRRWAAPHDLWVHVETGPGAHVIIRRNHPGQEVPQGTLLEAGALAARKSWLAESATARVSFAELRHIKPMRNAPEGMVRIDKTQFTLLVPVDKDIESKLSEKNGREES